MAFLCVSQQGEFKNTTKNFLGEVHVKNFWPKKLRERKKSCRLFPSIFFNRVFWPFLCIKIFFKSDLKISTEWRVYARSRDPDIKNKGRGSHLGMCFVCLFFTKKNRDPSKQMRVCFPVFFCSICFIAFLDVLQQGEFKNAIKKTRTFFRTAKKIFKNAPPPPPPPPPPRRPLNCVFDLLSTCTLALAFF
jgi:hypothetical protein